LTNKEKSNASSQFTIKLIKQHIDKVSKMRELKHQGGLLFQPILQCNGEMQYYPRLSMKAVNGVDYSLVSLLL
jgi:hypothetical protein